MSYELKRTWKVVVMEYLMVISQHFIQGTEKITKK
jgi:hypothetical protein